MKKIILFGTAILILHSSFAQSPDWLWAKSFGDIIGDESGKVMTLDAFDNVYTAGRFQGTVDFDPGPGIDTLTSAAGSVDIYISKVDALGNFVWAKRIGGANLETCYSLAIDNSGNVYGTGHFFQDTLDLDPGPGTYNLIATGGADLFTFKWDSSANFIWAKRIGEPATGYVLGKSVSIDSYSNIFTVGEYSGLSDFDPGPGTFNLPPALQTTVFISKWDSAGNFIWAKAFGGANPHYNSFLSVIDAVGNIYTAGDFNGSRDFNPGAGVYNLTSTGLTDIFISKYDSAGNFIWAKSVGGPSDFDYPNGIALSPSGNAVYITGPFNATIDFDPGAGIFNLTSQGVSDIYILKLDSSGNFVWAKSIGSSGYDTSYSIATDSSDNIYTSGFFEGAVDFDPNAGTFNMSSAGVEDLFVSKLNSTGNFVWAVSTGGSGFEVALALAVGNSDNVYVTGSFGSSPVNFGPNVVMNSDTGGNTSDAFIAKLDTINVITGIESRKFDTGILIFPNPVTNQFSINDLQSAISEIEIYNIFGKKNFSQKPAAGNQHLTINVSDFSSGIYFVKLKGEGKECVAKFVKQ